MKRFVAMACLIPILLQPAPAQRRSNRTTPGQPPPLNQASNGVLVSGEVVLSDGTPLTEPAVIQSICRDQKRAETHTDSRGNFSFQFGGRVSSLSEVGFDADAPLDDRPANRLSLTDLQNCDLQASLPGFSSNTVRLGEGLSDSESVNIGRIVLHRLENVEGLTISATTAAAPAQARKAFAKGQEKEKKGQWAEAQKSFETAVALYPKFAAAWFELGRVQIQQNQPAAARQSFEHSIAADTKYINPYHGLMQLALHDQNWREMIETSDKVLVLNPINFPDAWFANGVGHFYLQNLAAAEQSARRGLALDNDHHVPKLEYLLGMVLLKENDYPEATLHLQAFLRMATKPADIADAQKQLDEIARLTAARTQAGPQAK